MNNQVQQVDAQELQVAQEMAKISTRSDFLEMIQRLSGYEVQVANVKVETDADEQMAVEALVAVKSLGKDFEGLRKGLVNFPNKLVKTINNTFRGLKDTVGKVEGKLTREIQGHRRKREEEEERLRKVAEEAAARQEIPVSNAETGVPDPPIVPKPSVTKSESGSFHEREETVVEVVDEVKLMKACLDNRVKKVPLAIMTIEMGVLKAAVKRGELKPGEWKKYGVRVEKVKKAVVRT